ncbi:RNA polymerase sigma factor SigM [Gordonia sp. VNK21]|uniref:RNA polymerase sigma factor SigM n=1 Tax=Gordonia sp. VNK21 TaxID=3382483 RepID=UPI0038D51331
MSFGGIAQTVSDADLLAACARSDGSAFTELVNRHRQHLWAVALRTTGDPDDAADALQDALLSIFRTAGHFRSDCTVVSWMHTIVVNSCLDRRRRNKSHSVCPLPEWDGALADHVQDFTDNVDLALSIGRALDVLPAHQRAVVVAVDVEGRSVQETARLLGIPAGTVKSRCSRARLKLALVLGHLREDD